MIHSTENRVTTGKVLALAVLVAALAASLLLATKPSHAATIFTVNSTADHADANLAVGSCDTGYDVTGVGGQQVDECTLKAAIEQANATPGSDTINFAIPGSGVKTIAPESALPAITKTLTINGYSQPGASPNTLAAGNDAVLKIELSGQSAGINVPGLRIEAANSTVKGLVVNRWIGTGIRINGSGATGNKVVGNYLGTDASGTQDLGNNEYGVSIEDAPNNAVGGATAGERNVISGNYDDGVRIYGSGATGNKVTGNYIGTDRNGTADLGNTSEGVYIYNAPNNAIGGTTAAARNVISGNDSEGVQINGNDATGNKVEGNYVGTDKFGTASLSNNDAGVAIGDAPNNFVGGTQAGARNVISGNGVGVYIAGDSATGNRILSNSIFANATLGIDLAGTDGPTPNDTLDPDTGPNNLQNKPLLTSAKTSRTSTTVRGTLNSTPNKTFLIQFFSNPSGEEGKTFRGHKNVTTDASGDASFVFATVGRVGVGQTMTVTATGAGNTSEFSAPRKVVAP